MVHQNEMFEKYNRIFAEKKSEVFELEEENILESLKSLVLELITTDTLKIPMLSTIARELLDIIDKPNTDFDKISHLIEKDQFVSAKILKIANSPLYASKYPVTKLDEAVRRMGLVEVKNLLFAISMSNFIMKKGSYSSFFEELWQHSIFIATACKEISKILNIDSQYFYVAGLLHDIGRSIVLMGIVELEKYMKKTDFFTLEIIKKVTFDFHTKVGDLVASKWKLPGSVRDSIVRHHDFQMVMQSDDSVKIVFASEKIVASLGYSDEISVDNILNEPIFYMLGMNENDIKFLLLKLDKLFISLKEVV